MENKFENELNKRMKELKLNPSASVWENVEKRLQLRKRKKKFFIVLFSVFLLSGILILTSLFYNRSAEKVPPANTNNPVAQNKQSEVEEPFENQVDKIKKQNIGNKKVDSSSTQNDGDKAVIPKSERNRDDSHVSGSIVGRNDASKTKYTGNKPDSIVTGIVNHKEENIWPDKKKFIISDSIEPVTARNSGDQQYTNPIDDISADAKNRIQESLKTTGLKNDSVIIVKNKSKDNKWKIGFSVNGGFTFLNNFYSSMDKSASAGQNYSGPPSSYEPDPFYKADIGGNMGVGAGILLQRPVGKKLSFVTGLNYQYFSTITKVGYQLSPEVFQATDSFYNYKNSFHYAGIPFTFHLEQGKNVPVALEAGFVFNTLISSNALQLKDTQYLADNSILNKFQIGFNAAVMFKITGNEKYQLSIGPYYYSAFNQLGKEGIYNKKHFNLVGLKTEFLIKR